MFPGEEEFVPRVRAVRDASGRVIGFQDPDQGNRFITRDQALNRLRYDPSQEQILDSFGNPVGAGSLAFPERGFSVATRSRFVNYRAGGDDPMLIRIRTGEELVEQVTFVDRNGRVYTVEHSFGKGRSYDPTVKGGWFRQKASEALGLRENERIPTRDLERAVVRRDYIVKISE